MSHINKPAFVRRILVKIPQHKISRKFVLWEPRRSMRTNKRTGIRKLRVVVSLRNGSANRRERCLEWVFVTVTNRRNTRCQQYMRAEVTPWVGTASSKYAKKKNHWASTDSSTVAQSSLRVLIIIIIIIIIWHYNPLWVFAFSAKSLQVLLSLAASFQFFFIFSFFKSSMTSSCHRCLGLLRVLIQSRNFPWIFN